MKGRKIRFATIAGPLVLAAAGMLLPRGQAQSSASVDPASTAGLTVAGLESVAAMIAVSAECLPEARLDRSLEVFRSIEDSGRGEHWLLVRDALHPSGPGRLIRSLQSNEELCLRQAAKRIPSGPVIRAGDRLLIEEHTAAADVELHAIALGPARAGKVLAARLTPGGNVLRVIASGPGRAILTPAEEKKP